MPQFPNQITQVVIIRDASGNIIVQIGPQPSVVVQAAPPSISYVQMAVSALNIPTLEFGDTLGNIFDINPIAGSGPGLTIGLNVPLTGADLTFFNDGNIGFVNFAGPTSVIMYDNVSGYFKMGTLTGSGVSLIGWTDAVLQNGWTNLGPTFANVGWRVFPDGTVRLRGAAVFGTSANGTVIFNLPVVARPKFTSEVLVKTSLTGNAAYLQIELNGDVQLNNMSGATNIVFDGCSFANI